MRLLSLTILALSSSHPASLASPGTAGAQEVSSGSASPRWQAIREGAFEEAATLPVHSPEEGHYLDGTAALARFDTDGAKAALAHLPEDSRFALELGWQLAHQRRDPKAIAAAAKALCAAGESTGRACVDAEFYEGRVVRGSVSLQGTSEVRLAPGAPFPLTLGQVLSQETGVIIDTGASQTVISSSLARRLNLATTKQRFPIGVAAGSGVTYARLAVLPELRVGEARVGTLPVLVVDLPELERNGIEVILAPQEALNGVTVEIDFAAHKLRLSEEAPKSADDDVVVPYLQAGFDLVVEAKVGEGRPGLFSFDTGMEHAFALGKQYSGDVVDATYRPTSGAVLHGAGASSTVQRLRPLPVKLGGVELAPSGGGVLTSIPKGKVFQIAGLLGNALWKDRVVVLDTKAHRILLRKPSGNGTLP